MTFEPGDKVTVRGWDGEVHTVSAYMAPLGTVALAGGELVKTDRCTPVKRPAKFPEDWGKKAEFSNGDGETHIYRIMGYISFAGIERPWIVVTDTYGAVRTYKYCYIYERGQS